MRVKLCLRDGGDEEEKKRRRTKKKKEEKGKIRVISEFRRR